MGAIDCVSAMVEREHCDPEPLLESGVGDRPAHRVRGPLGPAQRRPGPNLPAGAARPLRRSLRPLAGLPQRAQALPRPPRACDAGLPDRPADRSPGALGQSRTTASGCVSAGIAHPGPADRAHREQGRRRAPRAARAAAGVTEWVIASGSSRSRSPARATTWRARRTWSCCRAHGPRPLRRAGLGLTRGALNRRRPSARSRPRNRRPAGSAATTFAAGPTAAGQPVVDSSRWPCPFCWASASARGTKRRKIPRRPPAASISSPIEASRSAARSSRSAIPS